MLIKDKSLTDHPLNLDKLDLLFEHQFVSKRKPQTLKDIPKNQYNK
jgi:hypothetical protein